MDEVLNKKEQPTPEAKSENIVELDWEKLIETTESKVEHEAANAISEGEHILDTIPNVTENEKKEFGEIKNEIVNLQKETQNELEKSFDTNKKTPENFAKAASVLLSALRGMEESAERGYVFTYDPIMEKTSQGKEIKVDCLSWIGDDGFAIANKRRVVLVATDPVDGKVVGLRLSDIRQDGLLKDEKRGFVNKETITGEILTRLRGEGIAPALDNAFLKTVTKIVNYYKQEFLGEHQFNWVVENANLKRLNQKKEDGLSGPELEELETEQKRWQAVYGENGKLGFSKVDDTRYEKVVLPDFKEGENYEMPRVDMDKYHSIQAALEECVKTGE